MAIKSTKADELKMWVDKIQLAKEKQESEVLKPLHTYREYWRGKQWSEEMKHSSNDQIVDNMVYSNVSSIKPSINLNNPKIFVKPKKRKFINSDNQEMDATQAAVRVEILGEFLFEELEVKDEVDKALIDALIGHAGYVFIGHEVKLADEEDEAEEDIVSLIESESLFVDRLSAVDLLIDPESTDHSLKKSRWIAIKWVKKLDEVKNNKSYKNTFNVKTNAVIDSNPHQEGKPPVSPSNFEREKPSTTQAGTDWRERVEGWDIWDKDTHTLKTIVLEHNQFLQDKKWPLKYKGFPVEALWFNYNPDEQTPLADTQTYKTKQDFLNIFESKILDHVRRISDQKWGYNSGKAKGNKVEQFARGPSGSVIGVKGDPTTAITPFPTGNVSADLYATVQQLKKDITQQIGVAQFEAGGAENLATAQEGQLISQGISVRRQDRASTVEKFYKRIMEKLMSVAQQVIDEEQEIPLNDEQVGTLNKFSPDSLLSRKFDDGQGNQIIEKFPFMKIDSDLIGGRFSFNVQVGSTGPTNEQTERADALALAQYAAQNPLLDQNEVTQIVLEKFGFGSYIDRLMRDPKEVAQEQQASQEQQIKAQQAVDEPKRQTDLEKTQMKSQTSIEVAEITAGSKSNEISTNSRDRAKDRQLKAIQGLVDSTKRDKQNGDK